MISAVVLTKNEEKNIKECLKSLSFCNEIVVIDDNSEDETVGIAKKLGAKIFARDLAGNFSAQRNFGLEKARGEWILFVDTDERVRPALQEEIKKMTKENFDGFRLKRKDFFFGKFLQYGETGKIKLLRLAKKDKGRWQGKVHETWEVKGKIGELKNPLEHFPHPTVSSFLKEINLYSTLRAQELYEQGIKTNIFQIILFPLGKFLQNWLLKLGFLDGIQGFLMACFMSLHSFLVRGKLYLLWQK